MEVHFRGIGNLKKRLSQANKNVTGKVHRVCLRARVDWEREAKYRVPVETGLTRNTILSNLIDKGDDITVECGSNQKHAEHIEFGTKFIAGGRVLALGPSEHITDAQAIKDWAAKDANALPSANGRSRDSAGRFASSSREQMPWLRTSFNAIKQKLLDGLKDALRMKK